MRPRCPGCGRPHDPRAVRCPACHRVLLSDGPGAQINVNPPGSAPNRRNLYLAIAAAVLALIIILLVVFGSRPGGFLNVNVNRPAGATPAAVAPAPTLLPTFTSTVPPATPTAAATPTTAATPTPQPSPSPAVAAAATPTPTTAPTAPAATPTAAPSAGSPPPPPPLPSPPAASASPSPAPGPVAIAVVPDPGALALTVAQEQGYLTSAGIQADISQVAADSVALPAVAAGQRAVGYGDALQVVGQRQGVAFLGPVSVEGNGRWTHRYLVSATANVTGPRALEGKSVGLPLTGGVAELAFRAWAEKNGVDATKVSLVAVPYAQMANALRSGQVAMVDAESPYADAIAADGATALDAQPYSALGSAVITGGWYANRAWLQSNEATARDFAGALARAEQWVASNQADARALLARLAGMPAAAAANAVLPQLAQVSPGALQSLIDAATRYGLLRERVQPSEVIAPVR